MNLVTHWLTSAAKKHPLKFLPFSEQLHGILA